MKRESALRISMTKPNLIKYPWYRDAFPAMSKMPRSALESVSAAEPVCQRTAVSAGGDGREGTARRTAAGSTSRISGHRNR